MLCLTLCRNQIGIKLIGKLLALFRSVCLLVIYTTQKFASMGTFSLLNICCACRKSTVCKLRTAPDPATYKVSNSSPSSISSENTLALFDRDNAYTGATAVSETGSVNAARVLPSTNRRLQFARHVRPVNHLRQATPLQTMIIYHPTSSKEYNSKPSSTNPDTNTTSFQHSISSY